MLNALREYWFILGLLGYVLILMDYSCAQGLDNWHDDCPCAVVGGEMGCLFELFTFKMFTPKTPNVGLLHHFYNGGEVIVSVWQVLSFPLM